MSSLRITVSPVIQLAEPDYIDHFMVKEKFENTFTATKEQQEKQETTLQIFT